MQCNQKSLENKAGDSTLMNVKVNDAHNLLLEVADLRGGAQGTRAPGNRIFFKFHAVFGKF